MSLGNGSKRIIIDGGIIFLLLLSIGIGGYFVNETKKTIDNFIERWDKRVGISNQINNASKNRDTQIFQQQLHNEKNLIGNLTNHRIIANQTYDGLKQDHELIMKSLNITRDHPKTEASEKADKVLEILNNFLNQSNSSTLIK